MKKLVLFLLAALLIMAPACHQQKTATVSEDTFDVIVGDSTYTVPNVLIDAPDVTLRGHSNQVAVIAYLSSIADGIASVVNVTDAIKGEKLTTFSIWLKLVPVLTKEIPTLVKSGKHLAQFNTLYTNAQGLTPDERAAVANAFATKFSLPKEEAEKIAELVIESAVLNMKLAGTIKTAIETKKNR